MLRELSSIEGTPTTHWLVGFRWAVTACYAIAFVVACAVSAHHTALIATALGAVATGLTNRFLHQRAGGRATDASDRFVAAALVLDVSLLAIGLAMTGGASNPFAILLIVHIVLAGLISRSAWSWTVVIAVAAVYGSLFFISADMHLWHQTIDLFTTGQPVQLHLVGMWVATTIAAVAITAFTRQVLHALERHRSFLRDTERRLERTTHLASLTTLAAGAAHELGSPLTSVAVLARELEREAEEQSASSLREDAATIRDEVDRCREILDRMSAGVGIQLGGIDARPCAPSLLDSVNERLETRASRVTWQGRLEDLTAAEVAQLTELVLPLVGNALDACDRGPVNISVSDVSDELSIEVQDHGAGMNQEVLSRSVEPFFTTKAPGHGMGLGLHLVRVVSDAMGGQLTLSSLPGDGTKARLILPRGSLAVQAGAVS